MEVFITVHKTDPRESYGKNSVEIGSHLPKSVMMKRQVLTRGHCNRD